MTSVLGIDPGQKGAMVLLQARDGLIVATDTFLMPATPKVGLDRAAMWSLLREISLQHHLVVAWMEKAQAMPRQGVSSTFKYGRDYGAILMALTALEVPQHDVSPGVWHRRVVGTKPKGESRSHAKARALAVVRDRLPRMDLVPPGKRVAHDGIVDAACIAMYGLDRMRRGA